MERQKKIRDLEIKAYRTGQKVERRAPFYALAMRRMGDAIASTEKDAAILTSSLHNLLATIPQTIPPAQEEERRLARDETPSQIPLPSRELYNQINSAKSSLSSIHEMQSNMHDILRNLQQKQIYERRESETAQLALNEARAGRMDTWYWDAGRVKREADEREDNTFELEFNRMKSERKAKFDNSIGPADVIMKEYREREGIALRKLASGIRADGSAVTSPADSMAASTELTQQAIVQQQQAIMLSNMMWAQHIGTVN
ncbi:9122_t:CDS:1, partial [Acaulospora colombiana]